jgi:uncharacterized protein (DUF983 family)
MTPALVLYLAVVPGFVLMITGAVALTIQAARGRSGRTSYRVMALGMGVIPLACGLWLLLAAEQPLWVKLVGAPPLILVSAVFLVRARRLTEAVDFP